MIRPLVVFALFLAPAATQAICDFDGTGTISNPDDPACRDAQFVYTENDNSGNNIALGYPPPVPVDSLTAVDGFRTYDSLFARHQDLLLTEASVSGTVVGQTRGGRDVWAYTLGDADSETIDGFTEGAAIINGGIHAREWQSPEVVTEIFEQLVERATDEGVGQYLHDNFNVVLIPVLNVDGFIQTQNFPTRATADVRQPRDGRMRRKNLLLPAGGTVDESLDTTDDSFFGVDLNRNSIHGFGQNGGSSDNPISLVYRGGAHSSEPEIQALRAATAMGPADRLRLGVDVHSFTQIYFTPLTGNVRRDAITQALAARMRAVTNFKYRYAPDPVGTFGIGTVADYFAYQFQIPAWTLEIEPLNGGQDYGGTGVSHSGFVLPDSEIARVRDELADTHLLGFYRQAGPAHINAVQITNLSRDEVVYDAEWINEGTTRRLQVNVSSALVPSDEHRMWLGFSKPMRLINTEGNVSNFPGQVSTAQQVEFNAPDGSFGIVHSLTAANGWQAQPGGAPNGYQQYRGDALVVDLPWPQLAISVPTPTAVAIQIGMTDIAQMRLDADPATPVDWENGHWTGYEDSALEESDTGGTNCSFIVFFANDPDATAPAMDAVCQAFSNASEPLPTPPPPTPPPAPAPGGGGGNGLWLLPPALLALRRS